MSGNHAAAYGVKLAGPKLIPVYPITPQTPVLEKISEFKAQGELDADLMTVESEHSAMAACTAASLTGVRVFTATASQGLALMHEMLHYAAGARTPIVMVNVNRTIASPWAFWPDYSDSLSQRDTGWLQFYCEHNQEVLDTVIQAFRVAEQVYLPVMVVYEALYISHTMECIQVPGRDLVEQYLPPYRPLNQLDIRRPSSFGNVVTPALWQKHRRQIHEAMNAAIPAATEADRQWQTLTGRSYGILERYRVEDADLVLVTLGGLTGTAREAVNLLRRQGYRAGLLKIRLFRPFPAEILRNLLQGVPQIVVLDRNCAPGTGGTLGQEIKAALCGLENAPDVHSYMVGVGGVNVAPGDIAAIAKSCWEIKAVNNSRWAGERNA